MSRLLPLILLAGSLGLAGWSTASSAQATYCFHTPKAHVGPVQVNRGSDVCILRPTGSQDPTAPEPVAT